MKILRTAALALSLLAFPAVHAAQTGHGGGGTGGTWGGPGDTVPPGGGGGGGNVPPPGHVPPPSSTGGAGGAGGLPGLPPRTPWGDGPPPPGYPGLPTTESTPDEPGSRPRVDDPASWQIWWHYNRWEYLTIDHDALEATTGAGGFYLGRGEKTQPSNRLRATRDQVREAVIPALAKALRASDGERFPIDGLQAFAKLRGVEPADPDDKFLGVAGRFITSNSAAVSEKAVLAMGVHGDPASFLRLHSILHDETAGRAWLGRASIGLRTRVFAAYALGLLGSRHDDADLRLRVHTSLTRALQEDRPELQAAAVMSLGLIPLPLDPTELPSAGDDGAAITRVEQVLQLLAFFEDPDRSMEARSQVPTALIHLTEGVSDSLRRRTARAMLDAVEVRSVAPPEVQAAAVIALGRLGRSDLSDVDLLVRKELERIAFRSHDPRLTRYRAIVSLARVASQPGTGDEPLAGLEITRKLFLRNLGRHRGDSLCWTALGLGILESKAGDRDEVPDPTCAAALRLLVEKARAAEVIGAAALALGMLRDQEAEPLLTKIVQTSGNQEERAYASLALGMIGARHGIPLLRGQLEAAIHQPFPLEQIAISLAMLGDQSTGGRLQELQLEISDPAAQASIASAMGWIKDPRPLDKMAERLLDKSVGDELRAWTAVGIGRICDEDPLPWVGRLSIDVPYEVPLSALIEPEFKTGLLDLH